MKKSILLSALSVSGKKKVSMESQEVPLVTDETQVVSPEPSEIVDDSDEALVDNLGIVADSVESLENIRLMVAKLRTQGSRVTPVTLEAIQLAIDNATAKVSSKVKVVTFESINVNPTLSLEQLERNIVISQEGIIDDFSNWLSKTGDRMSAVNHSQELRNLAKIVTKNAETVSIRHGVANTEPGKEFISVVSGSCVELLAEAANSEAVLQVITKLCDINIKATKGYESSFITIMKNQVAEVKKGVRGNDLAREFFTNLETTLFVDGTVIDYAVRNTYSNQFRKLFGRVFKWTPKIAPNERYRNVKNVWGLRPEDIKPASAKVAALTTAVADYHDDQIARRNSMRKHVSAFLQSVKSEEPKAVASELRSMKQVYMASIEVDVMICHYMEISCRNLGAYLSDCIEWINRGNH